MVVSSEWGAIGIWPVEAREAAPPPQGAGRPHPTPSIAKSSCLQMSILLSLRNLEFDAEDGDSNPPVLCLWHKGRQVEEEVGIFF